eukprot:189995_1
MSVVHANVNKASIQVTNSPQFPSLPTKWKDRFDIRIWNELEAICNSALAEIASHKRKRTCTTILTTTWTIFFILANVLLGVYAGGGEEYCCSYDSYNNCQNWCRDYNYGAFVSSMVFYGLSGVLLFFVCPCVIHNDYYKKDDTQTYFNSLEDMAQMHFNSLNEKYQNMIVFKIISVHLPSNGCCGCCASNPQSETSSFELELEMKVQAITYIADVQSSLLSVQQQINSLPTQQQVTSLPTQTQTQTQTVQMVSALPIQPQLQQQTNMNSNQGFEQKHYTQWSTRDVLNWIVQLNGGQFAMYQQRLMETLNAEQIDGNDLCDLDKDDLHRLGIQNFKLKKSLLTHIQSLCQPAPAYQDLQPIQPSAPGAHEGAVTHS